MQNVAFLKTKSSLTARDVCIVVRIIIKVGLHSNFALTLPILAVRWNELESYYSSTVLLKIDM
jgi:hypothetical protein